MGVNALLSNTTVVATFGTITGGTGYTANLTASAATLSYVSGSTAISYPPVLITTNASGVVTACTLVTAADGTKGGTGFKDITTVMTCTTIGAGSGFAISPATLSTGIQNSAMGVNALQNNTTGSNNSAVGMQALQANTTGISNAAMGMNALQSNTTGNSNLAVGVNALLNNTTGAQNSAVGGNALLNNTTGSGVVGIGTSCASSTTTVSNEVNIYNQQVTARFQGAALAWTFVSDIRDKTAVEDLTLGLDFINLLKPRKFQWNLRHTDTDKGKVASGFIAQEVLAIVEATDTKYTGLVDTNDENQYTLAQTNLIPMLVNAIKELTARLETLEAK